MHAEERAANEKKYLMHAEERLANEKKYLMHAEERLANERCLKQFRGVCDM
jgi:hypothetical protein